MKPLIVFDRVEEIIVDIADDNNEDNNNQFSLLLNKFYLKTEFVKVLLTNRKNLDISGEHIINLRPFNLIETVQLFCKNCHYIKTIDEYNRIYSSLL